MLDAVLAERAYGMQAGCVRRYFVLDGNSIACVIVPMDAPCCADGRAPSPGDVLVILRDRQGRYVWRLRDDTTEEPLVGIPHGVDGSCSADVFSDSSTATSRSNSGYDGSGGPAGVSEPETTAAVSIPDATATALQSLATSDTVQQVRDRQDHVCRIIEAQVGGVAGASVAWHATLPPCCSHCCLLLCCACGGLTYQDPPLRCQHFSFVYVSMWDFIVPD